MWYRIDYRKLALFLLPPLLRSKLADALIQVLILPVRELYSQFTALMEETDSRLRISGHVQYLEKALNDAFELTDRQIYIDDSEGVSDSILYLLQEQQAAVMHKEEEGNGFILIRREESGVQINIRLKVPTFLVSSTDSPSERDRDNLRTIAEVVNIYKPAGRTYGIELYEYE